MKLYNPFSTAETITILGILTIIYYAIILRWLFRKDIISYLCDKSTSGKDELTIEQIKNYKKDDLLKDPPQA